MTKHPPVHLAAEYLALTTPATDARTARLLGLTTGQVKGMRELATPQRIAALRKRLNLYTLIHEKDPTDA